MKHETIRTIGESWLSDFFVPCSCDLCARGECGEQRKDKMKREIRQVLINQDWTIWRAASGTMLYGESVGGLPCHSIAALHATACGGQRGAECAGGEGGCCMNSMTPGMRRFLRTTIPFLSYLDGNVRYSSGEGFAYYDFFNMESGLGGWRIRTMAKFGRILQ